MNRKCISIFTILLLYFGCKKEEPQFSQTQIIQKESLAGFYILNEPNIENIRKAANRNVFSASSVVGIGCAFLDLNQNSVKFFFPLTSERFDFPLLDKFNYKEYKAYNGTLSRAEIQFGLQSQGNSVDLNANNSGGITGDFGNWKKSSQFAGKQLQSLDDCGVFPVQTKPDCKNGIVKGIYYINNKDGSALRSSPSFEGDVLDKIAFGTKIQIAESEEKEQAARWTKVEHNGKSGFLYKDSYDSVPICYDEKLSPQKIVDFTTLFNKAKIILPFQFPGTPPNYDLTIESDFTLDKPDDKQTKNQINKLPLKFTVEPYTDAGEAYFFDSIQYRKDDIKLRMIQVTFEYENPSNEYSRTYYDCVIYRDELMKLSPWNPEIVLNNCLKK